MLLIEFTSFLIALFLKFYSSLLKTLDGSGIPKRQFTVAYLSIYLIGSFGQSVPLISISRLWVAKVTVAYLITIEHKKTEDFKLKKGLHIVFYIYSIENVFKLRILSIFLLDLFCGLSGG